MLAEFRQFLFAGMTVGATHALAAGTLVARPIFKLRGHYLAMATLGLGLIINITLRLEAAPDFSGRARRRPEPQGNDESLCPGITKARLENRL